MHSSVEAQLATAWDMATGRISEQARQIEDLKAKLGKADDPRVRSAKAKQRAEIQIGQNALVEVIAMLKGKKPDTAGIQERLARVTALLDALKPADDETAEEAPAVTLESRR
jgi:hypothetical protein